MSNPQQDEAKLAMWEFTTLGAAVAEVSDFAQDMGKDGWELVAVVPQQWTSSNSLYLHYMQRVMLYFKRLLARAKALEGDK